MNEIYVLLPKEIGITIVEYFQLNALINNISNYAEILLKSDRVKIWFRVYEVTIILNSNTADNFAVSDFIIKFIAKYQMIHHTFESEHKFSDIVKLTYSIEHDRWEV